MEEFRSFQLSHKIKEVQRDIEVAEQSAIEIPLCDYVSEGDRCRRQGLFKPQGLDVYLCHMHKKRKYGMVCDNDPTSTKNFLRCERVFKGPAGPPLSGD